MKGDRDEQARSERARLDQAWLAVETCTRVGSVAVWRDGLAFEATFRIQETHSERLLPAIDHALRTTDTLPDELSSFVVGAGPGSFTGVRIGASIAKGWAMAKGIPLYAYSSLLSVAAGSGSDGPTCAMFDARRGCVYAACYDLSGGAVCQLLGPGAWPIGTLLSDLLRLDVKVAFAGEGAILNRKAIAHKLPGARILPEHMGTPRAANLLWLRENFPALGLVEQPGSWEPRYVRDWKLPEGESEDVRR